MVVPPAEINVECSGLTTSVQPTSSLAPGENDPSISRWERFKGLPGIGHVLQAAGVTIEAGRKVPVAKQLISTAETLIGAGKGIHADYKNAENKKYFWLATGGVFAYEVIGPLKLPSILTTDLAFRLEDNMDFPLSSVVASTPSAALAVAWGWGAARVLSNGIDNAPRYFAALNKGLPEESKVVELYPSLQIDRDPGGNLRKVGHGIKDGAGATAALGPQMYAAGMLKMSTEDREKLSRRLGVSGGIFWGASLAVLTGYAASIEDTNPELAATINHIAHDHFKLLLAFTGIQVATMLTKRPRKWAGQKISKAAHEIAEHLPEPIKHPATTMTLGMLATQLALKRGTRQLNPQKQLALAAEVE